MRVVGGREVGGWECGLMRQSARGAFFFNDAATTEIYTLPLHDALPICYGDTNAAKSDLAFDAGWKDRKSTR